MKKIAIAVALAVALGGVGFVTSADAAKAKFNDKRFIDCRKKVFKDRAFSPAYVHAIDQCYRGMPW
jgi:hypothetical protein